MNLEEYKVQALARYKKFLILAAIFLVVVVGFLYKQGNSEQTITLAVILVFGMVLGASMELPSLKKATGKGTK